MRELPVQGALNTVRRLLRQREGHAFPSRILKFVDVRGDLAVQSPGLFLVGLIRHLRKR